MPPPRSFLSRPPPVQSAAGGSLSRKMSESAPSHNTGLADARAHEALDELALEEEEAEEERRRGHERRGADDRPIDALVAGGEDLEPDGERPRLDRVRDDEGPEE